MTLGLGRAAVVKIAANDRYEMDVEALRAGDRRGPRRRPPADRDRRDRRHDVVHLGRPGRRDRRRRRARGPVAPRRRAYAGVVAILPDRRAPFAGWERADSIVVNPHKWLFTPLDASLLLSRRMDQLRAAFSLQPEYLRTLDRDQPRPRLQRVPAAARPAVAGAQAVDAAALVRARRAAAPDRGTTSRRPSVFAGWVDADPRLGAARARPVLDRLLPLSAGRRSAGDEAGRSTTTTPRSWTP